MSAHAALRPQPPLLGPVSRADPAVPATAAPALEPHLGALLAQLLAAGTAEDFRAMLQALLRGLDLGNAWSADRPVGA